MPQKKRNPELDSWLETNPLRAWRKSKGLSIRDVAAMLGTGSSSIQNWEGGMKPTPKWITEIAALMKTSLTETEMAFNRFRTSRPRID